jgi:hypothetical protein
LTAASTPSTAAPSLRADRLLPYFSVVVVIDLFLG